MRLSDLTADQQVLLAAWFALADAYPPGRHEELPIECQEALSELSQSTGKYPRSKLVRGSVTRGGKRLGAPAETGLIHGKRRQVRGARSKYALATSPSGSGLIAT